MKDKVNIELSIVLPTYNEADNIQRIIKEINRVLNDSRITGEILVVDDNSPDGTATVAEEMSGLFPVRVHKRVGEKGLSSAVIKGFQLARGEICMVMDADLSHPVEKIPEMIVPITNGTYDASVGSRYVPGGSCEKWSMQRIFISKTAGFLARGVTTLTDPTSGFMAIRKKMMDGVKLDPIGWKIVLETIVKTNAKTAEIPIDFADREKGKSKFNLRVQKDYLKHLWRLYCYKHRTLFEFIKFCSVGATGLVIDTAVLVSLVEAIALDPRLAAIFAFMAAVSWNYFLNRVWTFADGAYTQISKSYISFVAVSVSGLAVRLVTMHLLIEYANMGARPWYIVASIMGVMAGTIFNFLGSKYFSFSRKFLGKSV